MTSIALAGERKDENRQIMLLESTHHNHERSFYVKTVLGIDASKMLFESADRRIVEMRVLREHLLLEGWLDNAAKWLKEKSVDAFEAIKEKGTGVVEAMKEFPDKVAGIVAAFYKIMTDPKEAEAYLTGTLGSSRHKGFKKALLRIIEKFEEYGLDSFANRIRAFVNMIWGFLDKVGKGWRGFFSTLAFGIAVGKIKDQFGGQIKQLEEFLSEPTNTLVSILGGDVEDKLKNVSKEEMIKLLPGLMKNEAIQQRIIKATGFVDKAKEMVTNALKNLAGSALESLAGPIAWMKKAGEIFGAANEVVNTIESYLSRLDIMANESLLRRYVRQALVIELNRRRRRRYNANLLGPT